MKCFYHEDRDAVGTCQTCGKSLCKECAGKYTPVTCEDCHVAIVAKARNDREKAKQDALIDTKAEMIKAVAIGLVAGIVVVGSMYATHFEGLSLYWYAPIAYFLIAFGLPFGWALISHFLPFLIFRSEGGGVLWIFYVIIKFVLAAFIGFPAFLIQMVLLIIRYNKTKKM